MVHIASRAIEMHSIVTLHACRANSLTCRQIAGRDFILLFDLAGTSAPSPPASGRSSHNHQIIHDFASALTYSFDNTTCSSPVKMGIDLDKHHVRDGHRSM
jgi:hypothetical protein